VLEWLRDILWLAAAIVSSPVWLTSMIATGKVRTDWLGRLGVQDRLLKGAKPRLLVHAVSVGEVNSIREFVRLADGAWEVTVSTSTNTGFARARELFAPAHHVLRYPFDFHFAVRRFLDAVSPDVIVLVELETWPAMVRQCSKRGIPVVVVNGRISARSFRRYQRIRWAVKSMFRAVSAVAAQDQAIADRFVALGVSSARVQVMGSMKWDTAPVEVDRAGAAQLAERLGLDRERQTVVAGSTGPGEEELIFRAMRNLLAQGIQLVVAPRKPERFEEAASSLPGCVRWSTANGAERGQGGVFLLDTLGQLRNAYGLADVIVIGRTFNRMGGSDMIEAAAPGTATIVGPDVSAFEAPARLLLEAGGLIQVREDELGREVERLLRDGAARRHMQTAARRVAQTQRGVTRSYVELVAKFLPANSQK